MDKKHDAKTPSFRRPTYKILGYPEIYSSPQKPITRSSYHDIDKSTPWCYDHQSVIINSLMKPPKEYLRVVENDNGAVDLPATRAASEQAHRFALFDEVNAHFQRIIAAKAVAVLETGRFSPQDIDKLASCQGKLPAPLYGRSQFTDLNDMICDAGKFPGNFNIVDIIEAYEGGFRAMDVAECLESSLKYDDRLSAFGKFKLTIHEVDAEIVRQFLDEGLRDVRHILDAIFSNLQPSHIRDYDNTYSPFQISRFRRLRVPNSMAIQLTRRQLASALGKESIDWLERYDANINDGRGDYEAYGDVLSIVTRMKNEVRLTVRRYLAFMRYIK